MTRDNVPSSSKKFGGGGGGGGGDDFADAQAVTATGSTTKIEVHSGDQIDSIRVIYGAAGYSEVHGGNGGQADSFTVPDGHSIVRVEGRSGEVIDRLQFFTHQGAQSRVWGGLGGTPFSASASSGGALRTISGRSVWMFDQLTFEFGAPYFLESLEYNMDALDQARMNAQPQELARQQYDAKSTAYEAHWTYATTITKGQEISFSETIGFKFGTKLTENGPGISAEESTEFSLDTTMGNSYTSTSSINLSWDVPVPVPAHTTVTAITTVKHYTATVPFTYTVAWYEDGDRTKVIHREKFQGSYRGVQVDDIQHDIQEMANPATKSNA